MFLRITTNSDHGHEPAENVLRREFAVGKQDQLDRAWVCDITYIPTRERWLYLAIILDLASVWLWEAPILCTRCYESA